MRGALAATAVVSLGAGLTALLLGAFLDFTVVFAAVVFVAGVLVAALDGAAANELQASIMPVAASAPADGRSIKKGVDVFTVF